jgi:hypothetical protein
MDNYVKRFSGKEHMYPVGRAYRKDVHDYHISLVKSDPRSKRFIINSSGEGLDKD